MNYAEIARWSIIASSIAFAVILVWGFRKLGVPAIAASNDAKNREIAASEQRLAAIKARVAAQQADFASADSDAAAIRARAQEQANREHDAALQEATAGGERVVQNARGELERSRAAARDILRDELLAKALHEARAQAAKRADSAVNARLLDRFIDSLDRGGLN
ncbi:MAG: hypothetical protein M3126_12300 [Candidatus Eremiobacteraeota bacterium]|nr:hypothetical protein [Candidatus Eremiobacteraeota bacterium]